MEIFDLKNLWNVKFLSNHFTLCTKDSCGLVHSNPLAFALFTFHNFMKRDTKKQIHIMKSDFMKGDTCSNGT